MTLALCEVANGVIAAVPNQPSVFYPFKSAVLLPGEAITPSSNDSIYVHDATFGAFNNNDSTGEYVVLKGFVDSEEVSLATLVLHRGVINHANIQTSIGVSCDPGRDVIMTAANIEYALVTVRYAFIPAASYDGRT